MGEFSRRIGICVLVIGMMCVFIFPLAVHGEVKTFSGSPVTLFEKVTGTWCPPCGSVSPTIDKIWEYFGSSKLAIVEWHNGNPSGSYKDPFATKKSNYMCTYYGITGVPTVIVDGNTAGKIVGAYDYSTYSDAINATQINTRLFDITVTGNIASGSVTVHVDQLGPTSKTNVYLKCVVLESDKVYTGGTDPDNTYHHIARFPLDNESMTLPLPGGGQDFPKTFTVDSSWDSTKLSFVAYMQSETDKSVLQASFYGYGSVVPEVSPLVLLPVGGLFIALFALAPQRKK